jgi:hypothetical protein
LLIGDEVLRGAIELSSFFVNSVYGTFFASRTADCTLRIRILADSIQNSVPPDFFAIFQEASRSGVGFTSLSHPFVFVTCIEEVKVSILAIFKSHDQVSFGADSIDNRGTSFGV